MNENSEAFKVLSSAIFFCCFAQGTAKILRIKTIINEKTIIGCIEEIKLLSPIPIEFITTASEFLYN